MDSRYLEFGDDAHNVPLGLSTDRFNPFGQQRSTHSKWPLILVISNLPLYLAIRSAFILLSVIVPSMYASDNALISCIHSMKYNFECLMLLIVFDCMMCLGLKQVSNLDIFLTPLLDKLKLV